jgi:hypothetical protein
MKVIKLTINPSSPNIEVVDNFTMQVHVPYSDSSVFIKFNPNTTEYIENNDQPGVKVRQVMVSEDTPETKNLEFNFTDKNIHAIEIDGHKYEVKLLQIGNEDVEGIVGQKFKFFEFSINKI